MLIDLIKENGFTLKKAKSRRYPTQTIMDTNYKALLANTLNQAEHPLQSLQQVAGGIGFHVDADKVKYMCFNQEGDICPL